MAATQYHWILTAQYADGAVRSMDGTLTAPPGTTRLDLHKWAMAQMRERHGDGFVTVFFSIEPNALDGGAS